MSGRTTQILARFPAHLEPARVGKQLSAVTEALVSDLDQLSGDMAGVRRAHRLANADTLRDILLLGGLHGIDAGALDAILQVADFTRAQVAALETALAAGVPADRDAAAEALLDVCGIDAPAPRLPLFAPPNPGGVGPPDLDAAARRLLRGARARLGGTATREMARRRIGSLARIHADGNATVRTLIAAAASALDLELDLDENARVKELSRPMPTVATVGAAGDRAYGYVVMARSAARSVSRQSAPAVIASGAAALDGTNFNRITWAEVPDALDFLVYRVASGGTPATTGLITQTPLPATTTSFDDTGLAATLPLPPEIDDDLFHSRDLFWHSSFVRRGDGDLVRPVDAPPLANAVRMGATIAASDLAAALGTTVTVGEVLAAMAGLPAVELWMDADAAARQAGRFGVALRFPGDEPVPASTLARAIGARLAPARPSATLAVVHASALGAGTRPYAYVVAARAQGGRIVRAGPVVATDDGPAELGPAHFNRLSWPAAAGAEDYLVYRVLNGAAEAKLGLLTPTPLPAAPAAAPMSFDDTGLTAAAGSPAERDLAATDLVAGLVEAVAAGATVDFIIAPDVAGPVAAHFGRPIRRTDRVPIPPEIPVEELAVRIETKPGDLLPAAVAAVDRPGLDIQSTLSFDEASATLARLGMTAVAQRTISVAREITLAALANRLSLRVSRAAADLEVLGLAGADADTLLLPEQAAQLARQYGAAVEQMMPARPELIGLEENPLQEATDEHTVHQAMLWAVLRRGFSRVAMTVTIEGKANLTFSPMVVNRDEGHGIGYAGLVRDGQKLEFSPEGRAALDGADVTAFAYAWKGACFAGSDDDPIRPRDFVFDGPGADPARRATFAVATPDGALDASFTFPHAGNAIPMPGLGMGHTRFAYFLQEAHWSSETARVQPRPAVGFLDGSVFAPPSGTAPDSAVVTLDWFDHEAYAVRVLLPPRLTLIDADGIAKKVRGALDRVRAAGVEIRVEYIDEKWTLGSGPLAGGGAEDPILSLKGGSVLWPSPPT
jgi:hypothetical protein